MIDLERNIIAIKIVYFGPARSGKTTNLKALYDLLPDDRRAGAEFDNPDDATIFFDYFPVDVSGDDRFAVTIRLFTVSGQEGRSDARRAVLTGADGVVFVADAAAGREDENAASMAELIADLELLFPHQPERIPIVIQYNKLDLDDTSDSRTLPATLNTTGMPEVFASALQRRGVVETFELISREVVRRL